MNKFTFPLKNKLIEYVAVATRFFSASISLLLSLGVLLLSVLILFIGIVFLAFDYICTTGIAFIKMHQRGMTQNTTKTPKVKLIEFFVRTYRFISELITLLLSFGVLLLSAIALFIGAISCALDYVCTAGIAFIKAHRRVIIRYLAPALLSLFIIIDLSPYYPVAWKVSQYGGFEQLIQDTSHFDRSVIECDRQFGTEAYQLCLLDNARALAKAEYVQPATAILMAHAIALSIKHPGPLNAELKETGKKVISAGMKYIGLHQPSYDLANEVESARRSSVLLRVMTITTWDVGTQLRNQLSWEYQLLDAPTLADGLAMAGGINGQG